MVTVAGGKDQLVIEEFRNVLLQCNYKSNINATNVQWHFFNGTLHSLKDKTANQKLIVRLHNIKRSESGMYCCAVTNDVGVGSDGVKVIVTCEYNFKKYIHNITKPLSYILLCTSCTITAFNLIRFDYKHLEISFGPIIGLGIDTFSWFLR